MPTKFADFISPTTRRPYSRNLPWTLSGTFTFQEALEPSEPARSVHPFEAFWGRQELKIALEQSVEPVLVCHAIISTVLEVTFKVGRCSRHHSARKGQSHHVGPLRQRWYWKEQGPQMEWLLYADEVQLMGIEGHHSHRLHLEQCHFHPKRKLRPELAFCWLEEVKQLHLKKSSIDTNNCLI